MIEALVSILKWQELLSVFCNSKLIYYAKLSEKSVLKIKKLLLKNIHKQKIADKFNISLPTIYDIQSKRSWKHLSPIFNKKTGQYKLELFYTTL